MAAKKTGQKKLGLQGIRCRAFCQTQQKFLAKWRSSRDEAEADCAEHRKHPGNENHILRVIVEETTSEKFV